jgi:hypothetical protein
MRNVEGLTTASTVWVAAALALPAASGLGAQSRLTLAMLFATGWIDRSRSGTGAMIGNSPSVQRSEALWAGVRVQSHRDDKRGPALRSLYNNLGPHLLGQNLDHARSETGWLVERERIRQADAVITD